MVAAVIVASLLATVRPPVIHETFTPLPCPAKQVSTLDYEGCAEKRILATDASINRKAAAIFTRLAPGDRATFVEGERAWLRYRRATCLTEATKYKGGTLASLLDATCVADRNATHLRELTSLLGTLRRP
jgi:uncharacterized protein YecT (DUF1311 family)